MQLLVIASVVITLISNVIGSIIEATDRISIKSAEWFLITLSDLSTRNRDSQAGYSSKTDVPNSVWSLSDNRPHVRTGGSRNLTCLPINIIDGKIAGRWISLVTSRSIGLSEADDYKNANTPPTRKQATNHRRNTSKLVSIDDQSNTRNQQYFDV